MFTAYGIYSQNTKKGPSTKRLPCHKKTISFERIHNHKLLNEAKELFLSDNYILKSHIEYSKYSRSHLIYLLNEDEYRKLVENAIKKQIKSNIPKDKKLLIDTYLYENDKNDTGKKTKNSKLYAGYIVIDFKLDNKSIFKVQIDYMDKDIKDLENRIDCAIQSFTTI